MQRDAFDAQIDVDAALDEPDPPVARRLREVALPTLVVVGADDVADFAAIAQRLAGEIPGAGPLVTIARAAHLPALERPAETAAAVLDFLGQRRRPQSSMCEPMTVVRSSGRPKYGTGSAALRAIAGTASCATAPSPARRWRRS